MHPLLLLLAAFPAGGAAEGVAWGASGGLVLPPAWHYSGPLITPEKRSADPSVAQKDPTVVYAGGKWHVFMTIKCPGSSK
ncbi:MAG: hypothetical protein QHJ73_14205, partial [Armatimonadota bacterium]|nr:hypothetical protein [Armatimonadota bacterium]